MKFRHSRDHQNNILIVEHYSVGVADDEEGDPRLTKKAEAIIASEEKSLDAQLAAKAVLARIATAIR